MTTSAAVHQITVTKKKVRVWVLAQEKKKQKGKMLKLDPR